MKEKIKNRVKVLCRCMVIERKPTSAFAVCRYFHAFLSSFIPSPMAFPRSLTIDANMQQPQCISYSAQDKDWPLKERLTC